MPNAKPSLTKYAMYEAAVQEPSVEFDAMQQMFRDQKRPLARRVREDFSASALNSVYWVGEDERNEAVGVDIDGKMLKEIAWPAAIKKLTPDQLLRFTLVTSDVASKNLLELPRFDAVLALNFSYWIFKQRKQMLEYFTNVRRALKPRGLFILDFFGGSDVLVELQERRRCKGFTYIWDQHRYNAINGDFDCKIHFELKNGRRIRNAFEYPWRLWTIPELRDIAIDAGFRAMDVYVEKENRKGKGTGYYKRVTSVPADRSFLCNLVCVP